MLFERCNEISYSSKAEWLTNRSIGIGGSDIATVIGVNKYKTDYQLWKEKTGIEVGEDISENEAVKRGIVSEPHLLGLLNAYYPEKKFFNPDITFKRKDKPWMLANLDGVSEDLTEGLEIKTAKVRNLEHWKDSIPDQYYCQVQWYMGVTGIKKFTLFAAVEVISFDDKEVPTRYLIEHHIDRNEEDIKYLEEEAEKFWIQVKNKKWNQFNLEIEL